MFSQHSKAVLLPRPKPEDSQLTMQPGREFWDLNRSCTLFLHLYLSYGKTSFHAQEAWRTQLPWLEHTCSLSHSVFRTLLKYHLLSIRPDRTRCSALWNSFIKKKKNSFNIITNFPSQKDLSHPGIKPRSTILRVASCIADRFFTNWTTREAQIIMLIFTYLVVLVLFLKLINLF